MTAGNGPSIWDGGLSRELIASATTPQLVRAHVDYKVGEGRTIRGRHATSSDLQFHSMIVDTLRSRGVLD